VAGELVSRYGTAIKEIVLVPSGGGIFTVEVDGRQVFSKKEVGRFPEEGETVRLVEEARG